MGSQAGMVCDSLGYIGRVSTGVSTWSELLGSASSSSRFLGTLRLQ